MSEKSVKRETAPIKARERAYGTGHKLIGKDYPTPDLYAKVTGLAKYAEDYHADGMLFCKLLLSPLPHAPRQAHRYARGAGHARREGDSHGAMNFRRQPIA